jgi:hypothetical protein
VFECAARLRVGAGEPLHDARGSRAARIGALGRHVGHSSGKRRRAARSEAKPSGVEQQAAPRRAQQPRERSMTIKLQEKMAAISLGRFSTEGESLEGIFLAGAAGDDDRGAVIAPPHPLYGGSMESPVLAELAFACHRTGIATLRFNWRGVGASAGEASDDERVADEDYGSALAYMAETVPGVLLACGYSFGCAAAVRAAERSPRVRRLVLVAPAPALIAPERIAALRARTLVITGDRDSFVPLPALEAAFAGAPNVTLRVLRGVDHFFMDGLGALGREASEWLGD